MRYKPNNEKDTDKIKKKRVSEWQDAFKAHKVTEARRLQGASSRISSEGHYGKRYYYNKLIELVECLQYSRKMMMLSTTRMLTLKWIENKIKLQVDFEMQMIGILETRTHM
jgi:hypothetical protein